MTILKVRERRAYTKVWHRDDLEAWWQWFTRHLRDQVYRPGLHCGNCPRGTTCPAKTAHLRQGGEWLVDRAASWELPTDPVELANVLAGAVERARLVTAAAKTVIELAKAHVIAAGGKMMADDGVELVINEQNTRHISLDRGRQVLIDTLGEAKVWELASIGKGDVESAIKDITPRGAKGQAVKALLDRLENEGAITSTIVQRLEVKRHGPSSHTTTDNGDGGALKLFDAPDDIGAAAAPG